MIGKTLDESNLFNQGQFVVEKGEEEQYRQERRMCGRVYHQLKIILYLNHLHCKEARCRREMYFQLDIHLDSE